MMPEMPRHSNLRKSCSHFDSPALPPRSRRNQMNTYQVRLEGREEVAESTMAFHFEKPSSFSFKPGQAVDVVINLPAGQKASHTFSLVSAPFENELIVATRMRNSVFKQA